MFDFVSELRSGDLFAGKVRTNRRGTRTVRHKIVQQITSLGRWILEALQSLKYPA
jgi:hypothetical protein